MEIFKLFGSIFVDNEQANKSLNKTDTLGYKVGQTFQNVVKVAAAMSAAAIAAGGAIYGMATKAADAGDRVDKLSQRLGLSREGFQEWEYVLSQSGVSIDSMQSGMKNLSQRMNEASEGAGKGAELFEKLNIKIKEGDTQEDIFNKTITALQGMEEGHEKAALAQDLFGRSGQELLPLLNSQSASVEELKNKAREMGIILDDDAIDASVKLTDTLDTMKRAVGGVVNNIGVSLIPMIQKFGDFVINHAPEIQATFSTVFNAIGTYVETFITIIQKVISWGMQWVENNRGQLESISNTFMTIFNKVRDLIIAFISFAQDVWDKYGERITTATTAAFDIIKGIFSTVFNVISDLLDVFTALFEGDWDAFWTAISNLTITIWNGIKEFIGNMLDTIIAIIKAIVPAAIDAGKALFTGVWDGIKNIWESVKEWLGNRLDEFIVSMLSFIPDALEAGKKLFTGVWDGLKSVWSGISSWVSDKVSWITDKLAFWKKSSSEMDESDNNPRSPDTPPSSNASVPRLARGGTVRESGRVIVGETGKEVLELEKGAKVTPLERYIKENEQSKSETKQTILAKALVGVQTLIVREEADINKISKLLDEKIKDAQRGYAIS